MALLGGAAAAWPIGAGAQQPMPVIGYLSAGSPDSDDFRLTAFRQGLKENRLCRGRERRYRIPLGAGPIRSITGSGSRSGSSPGGRDCHTRPPLRHSLPRRRPQPYRSSSCLGIDPVQSGLVASLNRPGGNVTGVANLTAELAGKRLDLLHELVPTAAAIALLVNPTNPSNSELETRSLRDASRSLGLQLHVLPASTASEIDAAFGTLVELRAGALVVAGDPFFTNQP